MGKKGVLTWKSATKAGVGMLDRDELELMKYSSYVPNAVDKVFFKLAHLLFSATWFFIITLLILLLLNNELAVAVISTYTNTLTLKQNEMLGTIVWFALVFITLPGLAGSVYVCKVTGYKLLKIDIGLRLIILSIVLYYLIPITIKIFLPTISEIFNRLMSA